MQCCQVLSGVHTRPAGAIGAERIVDTTQAGATDMSDMLTQRLQMLARSLQKVSNILSFCSIWPFPHALSLNVPDQAVTVSEKPRSYNIVRERKVAVQVCREALAQGSQFGSSGCRCHCLHARPPQADLPCSAVAPAQSWSCSRGTGHGPDLSRTRSDARGRISWHPPARPVGRSPAARGRAVHSRRDRSLHSSLFRSLIGKGRLRHRQCRMRHRPPDGHACIECTRRRATRPTAGSKFQPAGLFHWRAVDCTPARAHPVQPSAARVEQWQWQQLLTTASQRAPTMSGSTAGFETTCRDFFFLGDRLAGAVLHAIESADPTCPADVRDPAAFAARLSAALGGRALASLGDDGRAELREIRDRIRGQFHAQNTEVQRTELELLLVASRERTALLAGRHATPPGGDTQRLEQFVSSHRTNVGTHPFMAGLSATLRAQLRQPRCVTWLLDDAVLTQAGGLGFAEAAVELLVEGLGFKHSVPEDVEGESEGSHVRSSNRWPSRCMRLSMDLVCAGLGRLGQLE